MQLSLKGPEDIVKIEKVAVIGAGVMGSGIAAHVANAGLPVTLLDIVPKGAENRNIITETAVQKMLKPVRMGSPTPLMHRKNARLITTGNIEDHLDALGDADLIIEVVLEKLEIKHDVFKKIDKVRKKNSLVTSNTSTIPRNQLVKGMSKAFASDFIITHFFNPPRYLRLLEIVAGKEVSKKKIDAVTEFCDIKLGKEVVICNDTPGFIGNRVGTYWTLIGMVEAVRMGLTVEEADAIMGRPIGAPKTGIFALGDVVGLDLIPHVTESMSSNLPKNDLYNLGVKEQNKLGIDKILSSMIADGYTGRKGKGAVDIPVPGYADQFGGAQVHEQEEGAAPLCRHRCHQVGTTQEVPLDHGLAAQLPDRGRGHRQLSEDQQARCQGRHPVPERRLW